MAQDVDVDALPERNEVAAILQCEAATIVRDEAVVTRFYQSDRQDGVGC